MRERFLELLRCPECRGTLTAAGVTGREGDDLREGNLACTACARQFALRDGIPIFVPEDHYAENFGWQWTRFAKLQRDSYNKSTIVQNTILRRSGWTPEWLKDKRVLECGCGSGNDSEVLQSLCKEVVSFDLSHGVHAASDEVRRSQNGMQMQADIRKIPVAEEAFDVVYCHRVIQHTPEPAASFASMVRHLKPGGTFFLHSYDTHWKSLANYKYLWRPLTTRMPHSAVYRALRIFGPLLYPLAGLFDEIAPIRRIGRLLVPFEYHGRVLRRGKARLTFKERYEYSLLITFDALTPTYDQPNPPEVLMGWFAEQGLEDVELRRRSPVIVVGKKPAKKQARTPDPVTAPAR